MRIGMFQMDVELGKIESNLSQLYNWLVAHKGECDLLVLPEMFTTGFCVESVEWAEAFDGPSITQLKKWSKEFDVALVGSLMMSKDGRNYNRAFFLMPEEESFFYDKRHLFQGVEATLFSSGEERVVVPYKGWNILLQVCYDLRFPVFSRNRRNDYDLALYVACWPTPRINAWKTLLQARAIENLSYVCGVNAVWTDAKGRKQGGSSMLVDMNGIVKREFEAESACVEVFDVQKVDLETFRESFPAWKDSDEFSIG